MLKPAEKSNYKSLHLNNLDKRYLNNNNKNRKILNVKNVKFMNKLSINKRITSTQSRSNIQFTQSIFKSNKFNDGKKEHAGKLIGDKKSITYIKNIPVDLNNNCHLTQNSVDYTCGKFL